MCNYNKFSRHFERTFIKDHLMSKNVANLKNYDLNIFPHISKLFADICLIRSWLVTFYYPPLFLTMSWNWQLWYSTLYEWHLLTSMITSCFLMCPWSSQVGFNIRLNRMDVVYMYMGTVYMWSQSSMVISLSSNIPYYSTQNVTSHWSQAKVWNCKRNILSYGSQKFGRSFVS